MVVDTTYYDLLQIEPTATSLEVKKAYRKAAIKLHPDKNPDDPQAAAKFQEVGEAYQVLSDDSLRAKYDKYGKQESIPSQGFEDPSEFFSVIFGGEAFKDWIGELSLFQELSKSAELSGYTDEEGSDKKEAQNDKSVNQDKGTSSHVDVEETSAKRSGGNLYLEDKGSEEALKDTSDKQLSEKEKEELERKKELEKFEEECRLKKIETRNELAKKLVDKLSLFTETDMKEDVVESFRAKIQYEAESLKMESFGLEILHTIGSIYTTKSKIFLKNQTFLGWGGIWWSLKEKGGMAKDVFKAVNSALDAQKTMQEYAKMQEDNEYHAKKEEDEATADQDAVNDEIRELEKKLEELKRKQRESDESAAKDGEKGPSASSKDKEVDNSPKKHSPEDIAEMEKFMMGKILAAAWNGSKFEIQGTIRGVCDQILSDKDVGIETRVARANGLKIIGEVFKSVTRTEAEDEEARIFEELVAEASKKRNKNDRSSKSGEGTSK